MVSSGSLGSNSSSSNQQEANNQLSYSGSLLSESAKVMITNIQSLLKTVKTVEDEAQRGTRALESAIDAIHQEIKFNSGSNLISNDDIAKQQQYDSQVNLFSADDLIKSTKQITLATSKAIGAANSLRQEDIIVVANMGRKAVSDLLFVCHNAMVKLAREKRDNLIGSDDANYSQQIMNAGLGCATHYKDLLECIQAVSVLKFKKKP